MTRQRHHHINESANPNAINLIPAYPRVHRRSLILDCNAMSRAAVSAWRGLGTTVNPVCRDACQRLSRSKTRRDAIADNARLTGERWGTTPDGTEGQIMIQESAE